MRGARAHAAASAAPMLLLTIGCAEQPTPGPEAVGEPAPDLPAGPAGSPLAAAGRELFRGRAGCIACHADTPDGFGLARSMVGYFGTTVELDDGRRVVADAAFVARSIAEPDADVAAGASDAMPWAPLDDEQIAALVAYIAALAEPGGPG